jgi:hypothetical protein
MERSSVADALRAKAADLRDSLLIASRDLDRLAREISSARAVVKPSSSQLELFGAAAMVHGYYTHLERLFERVARDLNSAPLDGPDWHRRLLQSMTIDRPGIRPAVLAPELAVLLDELLRFRHLFRNLYVLDLDGARIVAMLERVEAVHAPLRDAFSAFRAFLEDLMETPAS